MPTTSPQCHSCFTYCGLPPSSHEIHEVGTNGRHGQQKSPPMAG